MRNFCTKRKFVFAKKKNEGLKKSFRQDVITLHTRDELNRHITPNRHGKICMNEII